ncbi:LPS export ABC transporter periplasmic protein LptC [Chitinolyticbacter meiyuanensis]|uniref:LPS export ABC transporter periplasmic protein LptC n=1 Tax=Chitinolyticbacter meiyuanensis TaxID=682798 RepID=UPI0011E5DEF5|nr:LPS export ABC transporter periplasmic protein LptC [Chitinolyticbacter meiyuanensis]
MPMQHTGKLLPLILLGVLGLLVWVLNEAARMPELPKPQRKGEPDLVIEHIDAVRFGEDGQPLIKVTAVRTRHYPEDNSTWFDTARLDYTAPDAPAMHAVTSTAQGLQDSKRFWFPEAVTVVRDADAEHPQLVINGREIWMTTDTRRASSEAPVTAVSGPYNAAAVGFDADMIAGTLILKSKVSTVYEPPRR